MSWVRDIPLFRAGGRWFGTAALVDWVGPDLERALDRTLASRYRALDIAADLGIDIREDSRRVTEDWRRHRSLLSRDDTAIWLARFQLTLEDLLLFASRTASCRRVSLAQRQRGRVGQIQGRDRWAEFVISGRLAELTTHFANDVAASLEIGGSIVGAATRLSRCTITDQECERALLKHSHDWIRLRIRAAVVQSFDVAAEIAHQFRAGETALANMELDCFIDQLDQEQGSRLMGAVVGEVVGPVQTAQGWTVSYVTGRWSPSLRDPRVRRRCTETTASSAVELARLRSIDEWAADALG